jgi:hypothetical protein
MVGPPIAAGILHYTKATLGGTPNFLWINCG